MIDTRKLKAVQDQSIGLILVKYHKLPKEWVKSGDTKKGEGVFLVDEIYAELTRVSENTMYGCINFTKDVDMDNMTPEKRDEFHSELRALLNSVKGEIKKGSKVLNLFPETGDDKVIRNYGFIPVNI